MIGRAGETASAGEDGVFKRSERLHLYGIQLGGRVLCPDARRAPSRIGPHNVCTRAESMATLSFQNKSSKLLLWTRVVRPEIARPCTRSSNHGQDYKKLVRRARSAFTISKRRLESLG